ncbi:hypothetical protein [Candidatus Allofournierella excrementigallinarum]|uniref:hypothetical protein n=1 Tax=Candidatus Allofournierella excrementigallinarum TaxID=2838592 RepID=UPI00374F37AA
MPDNKFSGSVDEILETLKQQQAAAPASDRAVDEILAGLGLGDGLPLPPAQEAPAPQAPGAPKARPAANEAEEKPAPARPAPQQQARPAPARPAKAQPAPKAEAARPAPKAQPAKTQEAPRREAPAERPARRTVQRPAAKPAEAKAPAAQSEADEVIRQVQQTVAAPAPPSPDAMQQLTGTISETMQFDAEFQKFFSESVAVIPDEEPEQHPGFFARFLRHKDDGAGFEEDDELSETGEVKVDEPTLMIPNPARAPQPEEEPVALPMSGGPARPAEPDGGGAPEEGDTGVIELEGLDDGATRTLDDLDEAAGSIRFEDGPAEEPEEEPARKRGFLPRMFGGEAPAEAVFDEPEQPETIDDYEDPADAGAVQADLDGMRRMLALRTALTGILTVLLLYLGLAVGASPLPPIGPIDPAAAPAAYLAVHLIALLAACAVNWRVFASGVPGIWGRPSADTIPALAAAAALVQLVVQLVGADKFEADKLTLFAAPAALLLTLDAFGRFVMQGVVARNFRMASAGSDHTASVPLADAELTARLAQGLGEPEPCLLLNRPTSLVKGFLRQSFSLRASDGLAQKLSWGLLGAALAGALVSLFAGHGGVAAVNALAGALCLGGPLAATLLSAVPSLLAQKSAAQVGAVIPGAAAMEQLGRANIAVVGARDLVPGASVRLHGIKTFDKQRIDLAILYAASVLIEGCDTLRDVFMTIIQGKTEMLFKVENLENLPGYGFTAWVNNNRVIVGNRVFMQQQGLEIPSLDYENRYTKGRRLPVYLAVSGRLFAMFLVSYKANVQVAATLSDLRRQGVSLLVQSDDFNLTGEGLEVLYGLPAGSVKVLSGAERRMLAPHTAYAEASEGCMTHMGSFASFVGGLRAAAGAAWGEKVASLVQAAGVGISCLLALVMAFTGGIGALGLPALVLYQAAWAVLTLAMPLLKKY